MKVQFNSPETVAAFEWLAETYDRNGKYAAMLPPGVESWSDTSQQRGLPRRQDRLHAQRLQRLRRRPSATTTRSSRTSCCCTAPKANNGDSRDGGSRRRLADHLQGRAERRSRQEAGARPARPGELQPDVGGGRRPVHAGLREPVDRRAARGRSELRDHQGAGRASTDPFLGPSWPANPNAGDRRHPRPGRAGADRWAT